MRRILYILAIALSIVACTEEIDKSNRYTFTGETVADFMLNRSDKYSHFINLLERANLWGLLSTYGQYTLFLPNNEAVEKYLQEQDSIYHATKDSDNPVWTGVTSPLVEELSDSMATEIAKTHLIEKSYRTAEFGEGAISSINFAGKYLGVNYKVIEENFYIMINNHSAIIGGDNNVENGIIHIVDKIIDPRRKLLPEIIANYSFFSLWNKAMSATGYEKMLLSYSDHTFIPEELEYDQGGSYYGISPVYVPKNKQIRYTAFIETDNVFRSNGIETLDDLIAFAEKWYGSEDKGIYTSPRNALYKFVAYHFINRELPYNIVVPFDVFTDTPFHSEELMLPNHDRCDYYETQLNKLMKVVKPLSTTNAANIYINYNSKKHPYNPEMNRHLNIRVIALTEFTELDKSYASFNQMGENGIVHPIDKILIYNENEMAGNILNERIRMDIGTLIPELSSNGIRFFSSVAGGAYKIPNGYSESLKINNGLVLYLAAQAYLSDEFILGGKNFDISLRLPQLPAKVYEVRIGYTVYSSVNYPDRYMQFYLDNKITGLPIDILMSGSNPAIGWIADSDTYDNGLDNDRQLRNKGWMKAPDVFSSYSSQYVKNMSVRHFERYLRRIVTRQYWGTEEHWLRLRDLGGNFSDTQSSALHFDYIEFVPLHIINDPTKPEDRH